MKAPDYQVREWIEEEFTLTSDQKRVARNKESIRFSPFEFYTRRPRIKNIFIRFTVILMPIVWGILFVGLPFKFIISGQWGYGNKFMRFFDSWRSNIGL